jgi:N utilization substance protein A
MLGIEVPEIFDGLIVIKKIVREPVKELKLQWNPLTTVIDPVGACVGYEGKPYPWNRSRIGK